MEWVLAKNQQSELEEYNLVQNGESKLILKYNPLQLSARFSSQGRFHRLFYIENAGQFSSKTTFTDMYGMETASIYLDKINENAGTIILDGVRYNYQLQFNKTPVLVIYENNPAHPWVSCSLTNTIENSLISSFILGLAWYILMQEKKEKSVGYAAA